MADMTGWSVEALHHDLRQALRQDQVLYDSQSDHQRIVVFENETFGRVLTLDGVVQVTERDNFIYHEMLTHVPVLAHGAVRRVLIIGGGDGGMARAALRHDVEQVTMVEIDAGVVEFSRKFLPGISGDAFDDPRLDLQIADGADFMRETDGGYDVIIVDSTDPIGPGEVLFTDHFYGHAKKALTDGGILVTQNGVPFMQGGELTGTMRAFQSLFNDAYAYVAPVPTYQGGFMSFGWGTDSDARNVPLDVLEQRFRTAGLETDYYTPEVHKAAFALPGYIRRLIPGT
ncbi:polyamine aminopropyltransferase [Palleronia caenipelagi]|uniref:Polyamine aminopropyltransferase n=1 Tax=Palleronia caenipelagi TaxID=2489174 RepID=A0A547PNL0_9RHOB|nr:polyamine aminopropyltransferase [Palleronia caenipelagi]TRD15710.1 polyamine aminopropyltransferase [Palleronia caenipelagi]